MRRAAPSPTKEAVKTTSTSLWLPNDQVQLIKEAQSASSQLWPEWISNAIRHFMKEPPEEIEALLQSWVRGREHKTKINVRITNTCLEEIDQLCARVPDSSKQACLQHALYIHALRCLLPKS